MASYFHNEEVGSSSQNGAGSNFQESVLKRINAALGKTEDEFYQTISKSYFKKANSTLLFNFLPSSFSR